MKNFSQLLSNVTIGSIAAAGLLVGAGANAATITQTASYPSGGGTTPTNFLNQPVVPTLNQFDPTLGTLDSVMVTLTGSVFGTSRAESLDNAPSTITVTQSATVSFDVTGVPSSPVVQVIPLNAQTFNASAFDNVIDFGGTSGASFSDLTATATNMVTLTTPADLFAFIGTGTIAGLLSGTGNSTATGAGNIVSNFSTQAGGTVEIKYTYTPKDVVVPTPEPATLLGLGSVAALGFFGRKKKSNG